MCELSANKKQKERLTTKLYKLQTLLEEAKKERKEILTVSIVIFKFRLLDWRFMVCAYHRNSSTHANHKPKKNKLGPKVSV